MMKNHKDIGEIYMQETGRSVFGKTKDNTLVYCKQYIEWLELSLLKCDLSSASKEHILATKWITELTNAGYTYEDMSSIFKEAKRKYDEYKLRKQKT